MKAGPGTKQLCWHWPLEQAERWAAQGAGTLELRPRILGPLKVMRPAYGPQKAALRLEGLLRVEPEGLRKRLLQARAAGSAEAGQLL